MTKGELRFLLEREEDKERKLQEVVRALLPYARLYTPPEDDPDFDQIVAQQEALIALAERLSK